MIQINSQTKLSGEYKIVITNTETGISKETDWFDNIILNNGLDRIGNSGDGNILNYVQVGTGNSTPTFTQTSLDAYLANGGLDSSVITHEGAPLYRTLTTYKYTFAKGAAVGNISEIGVGWAGTGSVLFSRALIQDGSGNPTTITLTAIDQLTVYYRLRVAPDINDTTGTISISGTNYNYTMRMLNVNNFEPNFSSWTEFSSAYAFTVYSPGVSLSSITSAGMTGGSSDGGRISCTYPSYTTGNYYNDGTWTWAIDKGNLSGGIQGIALQWSWGRIQRQVLFSAPIPKDNTKVLTLVIRISWGRA